jgi:hypothetical protein
LGSHSKLESVGEIKNLGEYVKDNKLCSCGKKFSSCDYWNNIIDNYDAMIKNDQVKVNNPYHLRDYDREFSIFEKINIHMHGYENLYSKELIKEYGLKNYYLFKSMLKYSGKELIVDSSKNPYRLVMLKLSNLFDIKVIYLFRDGRANLESKKRKAQNSERGSARYPGAFKQTIRFVRKSNYIREVIRTLFNDCEVFALKYKVFTQQSKNSLNDFFDFFDLPQEIDIIDANSKNFFANQIQHNIGGNRLRFKEIDEIRYINKWENNLNKKEKVIFKMFGGNYINNSFNKYKNY